jgi:HAT1-interacting factor 1
VEELKTTPNEALGLSAPAMAAQALDKELNTDPSITTSTSAPVINDLTSTIKRKKKTSEVLTSAKRKAEGDAGPSNLDKKARLDTPSADI